MDIGNGPGEEEQLKLTDIVKEEGEVASKLPTLISEFVFISQEILAQNQNGTAKLSENMEAWMNNDLSLDLDE